MRNFDDIRPINAIGGKGKTKPAEQKTSTPPTKKK